MELMTRKFTAQSVALATGATPKEIANWADRGLITGHREPLGKGVKRAFSWFSVMEIGGAKALMEIGVKSPADAFAASQLFSHVSGGYGESGGWAGDQVADEASHRLAGLPYHHEKGVTYICVSAGRSEVHVSEDGKLNLNEVQRSLGNELGFIVLNMSRLFREIVQRMALDYREVLDEAYGK